MPSEFDKINSLQTIAAQVKSNMLTNNVNLQPDVKTLAYTFVHSIHTQRNAWILSLILEPETKLVSNVSFNTGRWKSVQLTRNTNLRSD